MLRHATLAAFAFGIANPATAANYDVNNRFILAHVERSDKGAVSHLRVTVTIPPVSPNIPAYTQVYFYGWIGEGNFKSPERLRVFQCVKSAECPEGFPGLTGSYQPGQSVTIEVDLPTAFVAAPHAHLHLGVGGTKTPYIPTGNLLVSL